MDTGRNMETTMLANSAARLHLKTRVLERLLHLFTSVSSLEQLQEDLLDISMEAVACEAASMLRATNKKGDLIFVAVRGPVGEKLKGVRLKAGQGMAGGCLLDRRTIAVSDVKSDPRHAAEVAKSLGFETRSLVATPILDGGDAMGVIELINRKGGDDFPRHELELLERVGRTAGALLRRKALEKKK